MIDSHCHLDDDRFDDDRVMMLDRSRTVGVDQWVIPATTRARWPKVCLIANDTPGAFASYGLHPMFMDEHQSRDLEKLMEWLQDHPAIAVGECGLDFFHSDDDCEQQLKLFRGQLAIAQERDLPVIIHARKALDPVLREIRQSGVRRGVVHSFSGSLQQAEQLIKLGFKLGIAATVGYERARKLREIVARVDLAGLLIESDAPDQPGPAHRGQRNEPAFLTAHLQDMAQLRGMDVEKLGMLLSDNCRQLFQLTGPG